MKPVFEFAHLPALRPDRRGTGIAVPAIDRSKASVPTID